MGYKISKLFDVFRSIIFIFKLISWTSIIILSGTIAIWFLPGNSEDEYKDDWELMAEWQEKQKNKKGNKK